MSTNIYKINYVFLLVSTDASIIFTYFQQTEYFARNSTPGLSKFRTILVSWLKNGKFEKVFAWSPETIICFTICFSALHIKCIK